MCYGVKLKFSSRRAGGNVSLQISTSGAGEGILVATVEEVAKKKHTYLRGAFPVEIKQLSSELFEIQFNPGTILMSECLLSIMYNDNHIPGSPFKMSFCEVNQCKASGEGLISAQVGVWNRFIVSTNHARPGALCVVIESGNGERVSPVITRLTPTLLEVCYRPPVPGNYSISLQLGQVPIPGSPFQVKCYSTVMCLSNLLQRYHWVYLYDSYYIPLVLDFDIREYSMMTYRSLQQTTLVRKLRVRFHWIKATVNLITQSCHVYRESTVNIQWKGDHIRGSLFNINIIAPPLPKNVHVHCLKEQ